MDARVSSKNKIKHCLLFIV